MSDGRQGTSFFYYLAEVGARGEGNAEGASGGGGGAGRAGRAGGAARGGRGSRRHRGRSICFS